MREELGDMTIGKAVLVALAVSLLGAVPTIASEQNVNQRTALTFSQPTASSSQSASTSQRREPAQTAIPLLLISVLGIASFGMAAALLLAARTLGRRRPVLVSRR